MNLKKDSNGLKNSLGCFPKTGKNASKHPQKDENSFLSTLILKYHFDYEILQITTN